MIWFATVLVIIKVTVDSTVSTLRLPQTISGREDASDHAWLAGGETTAAEEHVSALAANEDFDVTVRQRSRNEREPTAGLTAPATLVDRRSNASLAQQLLPPFSSKQRSIRQLPSIPQQNMTATPGSRAILKCRVENLGTKTVVWRKQHDVHPLAIGLFPFAADTRISADYNQRSNEWMLVIQDVRPSDEGLYYCQISTKGSHESNQNVKLSVKTVQVSGAQYIERGAPIRLECNATGRPDPPHDVSWFKAGRQLHSDAVRDVIITKNIETRMLVSVLIVRHAHLSDSAEYTCLSTNQDSANITVHVLNVDASLEKRDKGTLAEKIYARNNANNLNLGPNDRAHLILQSVIGLLIFIITQLLVQQLTFFKPETIIPKDNIKLS